MNPAYVVSGAALLLFALSYVTKRRFGILALGLAGGALLAGLWGPIGGNLLEAEGVGAGVLSPRGLASICMTLAPATLLLLRGPAYHTKLVRVGSSLLFVVFAFSLILPHLRPLLITSELGEGVYVYMSQFRDLVLSGGIFVALIDVFLIKPSARPKLQGKH